MSPHKKGKTMSDASSISNDSKSQAPKKHVRHMDHLASLHEKGRFVAKPDFLEDLLLNNEIPVAYYKLITVMLRHSSGFHIKRKYLEFRFGHSTLSKYLPQLEKDKVVRLDYQNGVKVYHTNPIGIWKLKGASYYSDSGHVDDPPVEEGPVEEGPVEEDHNQTKGKQTKGNQNSNLGQKSESSVDNPKDDQKDAKPKAPPKKKKLTKSSVIGSIISLVTYCTKEEAASCLDHFQREGFDMHQVNDTALHALENGAKFKNCDGDFRLCFLESLKKHQEQRIEEELNNIPF